MGRAQVMQAEAAGIAPDVRMNPILLKPTSDCGSQVILNGRAVGNQTAREYWGNKRALRPVVQAAYDSLASEYDILVLEGAGSPAEINLKQDDLVNMGMAEMADAPVVLVGDIDRGGVFASLYGTVMLLEPRERDRICGLVINKFRGDVDILRPGLAMLEQLTGKPVLGVVPYQPLDLDDEDSLSDQLSRDSCHAPVDLAVVRLPRISNFTDFSALPRVPGLGLRYVSRPDQLAGADLILLPGSKSTIADLKWLRESGLEAAILKAHAAGTPVFGVCGGYQMMGETIADPEGSEGGGSIRGMGLLPAETVFRAQKTTAQAAGELLAVEGDLAALTGHKTRGYEIHMGQTTLRPGAKPLQRLRRGEDTLLDGCQHQNAYGTYLHGVFDEGGVLGALAGALAQKKGVQLESGDFDMAQYKEAQYDALADTVRAALDMEQIYRILEGTA